MHTIEIDFDVFKGLTNLRESETVSYNEVIRRLLKMPEIKLSDGKTIEDGAVRTLLKGAKPSTGWSSKGVVFPDGSELRANYKGQTIFAKVADGTLIVNGQAANSPSDAARIVTGNNVNGWTFWQCRLPGESRWRGLKGMRDK